MPIFFDVLRPDTLKEAWRLLAEQSRTIAEQSRLLARLETENAGLRAEVAGLRAEVPPLRETVSQLQEQVAELVARGKQNSTNSSKPPSSDPPNNRPARSVRSPSGRKRGGQVGHVGHGRELQPLARVDRLVISWPVACERCGALLLGEDAEPERHQVTELPRVEPEVVEYQRHTLSCLACGHQTTGSWPEGMPAGGFGPRVQATVGYLTGRLGLSQRDTAEALETLYHTPVSLGSIPALERAVSAALAEPVAEVAAAVQQQAVANVDETSWRQDNRRYWLWASTTALMTAFLVLATRGARGAQQLLGEHYAGVTGSDRYKGYDWLDPQRRQFCWAHLKRDFQAMVDYGGAPATLGLALLAQVVEIFGRWQAYQVGDSDWTAFQQAMVPVLAEVHELLLKGAALGHAKTAGTCNHLLQHEVSLWTFVRVEGVEPTNNAAERVLRRAVLWRKRSFGTQSETGSRFVERILTTVTTLRQQRRDVLDTLTVACAAAITGDTPPSLLPSPPASASPA